MTWLGWSALAVIIFIGICKAVFEAGVLFLEIKAEIKALRSSALKPR